MSKPKSLASLNCRRSGSATFDHTAVGSITLGYRELWIDGTYDDVLMLWRCEDSESRHKLGELARLLAR